VAVGRAPVVGRALVVVRAAAALLAALAEIQIGRKEVISGTMAGKVSFEPA
jgi:hypothetical protein